MRILFKLCLIKGSPRRLCGRAGLRGCAGGGSAPWTRGEREPAVCGETRVIVVAVVGKERRGREVWCERAARHGHARPFQGVHTRQVLHRASEVLGDGEEAARWASAARASRPPPDDAARAPAARLWSFYYYLYGVRKLKAFKFFMCYFKHYWRKLSFHSSGPMADCTRRQSVDVFCDHPWSVS